MIFSHAPLGFIITYSASKIWRKKITKRQKFWIFITGILFSLFPDLDLFYYYFISTSETHRALLTHTPFLYLIIFLILFLASFIFKKAFLRIISIVILFTSFSHLLLDSLGSGIGWFYPFSDLLYGLLSFSFLSEGFYGQYLFAINYSIELLIIVIFLSLLFFIIFKNKNLRIIFIIFISILSVILIILLFCLNQHMFSKNSNNYYGDKDLDGIMNMKDLDMDGDGILNIDDPDANNNRKKNIEDIIEIAGRMEGVYHDRFEGGLYGLFSRFGFLSNIDVVLKPYDYAGIFLGKEMGEDFKEDSSDYFGTPEKDYLFHSRVENLYTYCKHKDLFIDTQNELKKGDIIFYKKGSKLNHTSLLVEDPDLVLDAGVESQVIEIGRENVGKEFGNINYYCRILK